MFKKNIIITGVLFMGIFLVACKSRENPELNPPEAGITGAAANSTPEAGITGKTMIPTPEPIYVPTDVPIITVIPDKHYKADEGEEAVEAIGQDITQMFYYEELTQDIKDRINGRSYGDDCTVPYDELRYIKVLYWGFDNEPHSGELIVNKAIAEDIVDIFKELYDQKYPIEQMVLVDEYDADDNASMAANNTSAFNYRVVDDGSGRLSNHSYGLAIDINPLYNPYVRKIDGDTVISPENGAAYADRSLDCAYYIKEGDACYQAFTEHGFTWGGDWKNSKDYQHFQKKPD